MANIKFSYHYRDGANYKNYKDVVFANPGNIRLEDVETFIRLRLIDEAFFYVDEWLLPDLHFGTWDNMIDHTWHEFESVSYTDEPSDFDTLLKEWMVHIG